MAIGSSSLPAPDAPRPLTADVTGHTAKSRARMNAVDEKSSDTGVIAASSVRLTLRRWITATQRRHAAHRVIFSCQLALCVRVISLPDAALLFVIARPALAFAAGFSPSFGTVTGLHLFQFGVSSAVCSHVEKASTSHKAHRLGLIHSSARVRLRNVA